MSSSIQKDLSLSQIASIGCYVVLTLLFILSPWIAAELLMSLSLGKPLTAVTPVWNDELVYWHGILTFLKAGFNGGYYTFDEFPAWLTLSHFDPHGPTFFVLMSFFSLWGQWTPQNAVYTNMLIMALGAVTYILCVRPSFGQLIAATCILGSFWYAAIFLPMTMQECFQMGAALAVSGVLGGLFLRGNQWGVLSVIFSIIFIVIVSLTRPIWSFSLIAVVLLWLERHHRRVSIKSVLLLMALAPLLFMIFAKTTAPYSEHGVTKDIIRELLLDPLNIITYFLNRIALLFTLIGKGLPIEIATRQACILLFVGSIYCIFHSLIAKRKAFREVSVEAPTIVFFSFGLPTLILFAMHDIFDLRDYRTLSPHLACGLLFLAAIRLYPVVALATVFHLTLIPSAVDAFKSLNQTRYTIDHSRIAHFASEAGKFIRYDSSTSSGWCNTVLTQAIVGYSFPPEVSALPAGIGFSVILGGDKIQQPIKSKYLLIDENRFQRFSSHVQLQPLSDFGQLKLYRNLGSGCP
jgi:hypothetical protein